MKIFLKTGKELEKAKDSLKKRYNWNDAEFIGGNPKKYPCVLVGFPFMSPSNAGIQINYVYKEDFK
jgi:hypothetical protein